jgi:hypothetical protein
LKERTVISCTRCKKPLSTQALNAFALVPCSACSVPTRADVYPALFRKLPTGRSGAHLQGEKEASCFYHPTKKASVACSACGRFLCTLCDVDFNDRHLCPVCLDKGKTKRKIKNLENHRICYDTVALSIALIASFFIWPTILSAPIVLYMVIRYWKAPGSIIPRSKIRFVLAFLISGLQIVGWIFVIGGLLTS